MLKCPGCGGGVRRHVEVGCRVKSCEWYWCDRCRLPYDPVGDERRRLAPKAKPRTA